MFPARPDERLRRAVGWDVGSLKPEGARWPGGAGPLCASREGEDRVMDNE